MSRTEVLKSVHSLRNQLVNSRASIERIRHDRWMSEGEKAEKVAEESRRAAAELKPLVDAAAKLAASTIQTLKPRYAPPVPSKIGVSNADYVQLAYIRDTLAARYKHSGTLTMERDWRAAIEAKDLPTVAVFQAYARDFWASAPSHSTPPHVSATLGSAPGSATSRFPENLKALEVESDMLLNPEKHSRADDLQAVEALQREIETTARIVDELGRTIVSPGNLNEQGGQDTTTVARERVRGMF